MLKIPAKILSFSKCCILLSAKTTNLVVAQVVNMCPTMELDTTDNCCLTGAGMTAIVERQEDNINDLTNDP